MLRQHVHGVAHAEDAVGAGLVGAEEQLVPGNFLRAFHFTGQKQRALVGEVGDDGIHLGGDAAAHHGVGGQRAAVVGDAPALEVAAGRGQHQRGVGLKGGEERLLGLFALLVGLGVLLAALGRGLRDAGSEVLVQLIAPLKRLLYVHSWLLLGR